MAEPKWFDKEHYLLKKAEHLQSYAKEYDGYTPEQAEELMTEAGFTPYEHFVAFGNSENVSPNAFFDVNYYVAAKAVHLSNLNHENNSNWTMQDVLDEFAEHGFTAWDHFCAFGWQEGVNPSATFDINAYLLEKTKQHNEIAHEGRSDWTVEQTKAAIADAGLNPISHYEQFGVNETVDGEALAPAAAADQAAVAAKQSGEGSVVINGTAELTLQEAVAAAEAGNLPDAYNLTAGTAEDLTVAQAGLVEDIVEGAGNAEGYNADYTLADNIANLVTASKQVADPDDDGVNVAMKVVDSYSNYAEASTKPEKITAYELTGTSGDERINVKDNFVNADTVLIAGGQGADMINIQQGTSGSVKAVFGGAISEYNSELKRYEESEDSINATGIWADYSFAKYLSNDAQALMSGANLLDVHGQSTIMVGSTAKDVFRLQDTTAVADTNIVAENPGNVTIHNFTLGEDAILLTSNAFYEAVNAALGISDPEGKTTLKNQTSADQLDLIAEHVKMQVNDNGSVTLGFKWSEVYASEGTYNGEEWTVDMSKALAYTDDSTITILGVDGFELGVTTAADFFQLA